MNKERLNKMVEMLTEVRNKTWTPSVKGKKLAQALDSYGGGNQPVEEFNLDTWVSSTKKNDCGFTACAIGHATLDTRFRRMGLNFNTFGGSPSYKNQSGFDAVTSFFNISNDKEDMDEDQVALTLYHPGHYPKRLKGEKLLDQVIRRHKLLLEIGIDKFLDKFSDNNTYCATRLVSPAGRVYNDTHVLRNRNWD